MATKNWFSATQKNSVNDTDKILVYDGTDSRTVEVSLIRGSSNVTNEYVELTGEDGNLYRVFVDYDGNTKAIKSEAFTSADPNPTDNIEDKYQVSEFLHKYFQEAKYEYEALKCEYEVYLWDLY